MRSEIGQYVNAVLNLVEKKEELDQIVFDLSTLGEKIGYKSVGSGADDGEKRKMLIESEMDNLGSDLLKDYFQGLINHSDLWIFEPGKFKIFSEELGKAANKIIYFKLITAIELRREDLKLMATKISKKMERRVLIDLTVDKSIIGGAIIQKDGFILDFSIKTKLQALSNEWKKALQRDSD
jgi:F-type H+-transporting ATPase subunit delta